MARLQMRNIATLTCPLCTHAWRERMPEDACKVQAECPGCHARLRRKEGDCCVYCSFADTSCPPEQMPA